MKAGSHFYDKTGNPKHFVEKKDGSGNRPSTVADCRKNDWYPSPTTVLKLLAKPALMDWLVRNAVIAFASDPLREGESLDDKITRVLDTERQQDQESQIAMDLGAAIHEAIEKALGMQPWDNSLKAYVDPVMGQLAHLGKCVASEKVLVNEIGYAGKTDCILENPEEFWVADFKTTKRIPERPYDEQKLQLASYCAALGNTGEKRIRGVILYVSTTEPGLVKAVECPDWPADFRRFKLLLEFWKLTNGI